MVLLPEDKDTCTKVVLLGPVVQSTVSLRSLLKSKLLKVYDFITNYTNIFVEKVREAAKACHILSRKILANFRY